ERSISLQKATTIGTALPYTLRGSTFKALANATARARSPALGSIKIVSGVLGGIEGETVGPVALPGYIIPLVSQCPSKNWPLIYLFLTHMHLIPLGILNTVM